ncbi:hypothetical protein AB0K93_36250, partial [Streptomyces sp. NPDC052676]
GSAAAAAPATAAPVAATAPVASGARAVLPTQASGTRAIQPTHASAAASAAGSGSASDRPASVPAPKRHTGLLDAPATPAATHTTRRREPAAVSRAGADTMYENRAPAAVGPLPYAPYHNPLCGVAYVPLPVLVDRHRTRIRS